MKVPNPETEKIIDEVLSSQQLAVLSTARDGQPYSSLMAFAHLEDLSALIVATGRATRKHINIMQESRVSLLVDTRSNNEADFHSATAITIIGKADIISDDEEKVEYQEIYLSRHPYLEDFIHSPSTSLIKITISHFLIVNRFQNVMEYHMTNEADIFT